MKAFTISAAVALLVAIAQAAPSPAQVDARQSSATIVFEGADDAALNTVVIPADGSVHAISMSILIDAIFFQSSHPRKIAIVLTIILDNSLNVSHIRCGPPGVICTIYGSLGGVTTCRGSSTVPFGPPQPAASVSCRAA